MVMSINTTKQHNKRFKSNAIIGIAFTSLFGVINGLVFSSGLLQADFSSSNIGFVLLGFNLGIEFGQVLFPCLYVRAP
jgi:hypothetical protein